MVETSPKAGNTGPSAGALLIALLVGAGAPLLWWWFSSPEPVAAQATPVALGLAPAASRAAVAGPQPARSEGQTSPGHNAAAVAQAPEPKPPQAPIARMRDPNGDQSLDITDFINPGEVPSMAEVISRLQAAGQYGGLGAFSPPGTRPPLVGNAVGEGFELPPGYVRHYQATDDGQRIEPILMFAPDHPQVAAAGGAAAPAQQRVVPPALVPSGLPLRQIVVPPPVEPGK